jgi:hypothetical protein
MSEKRREECKGKMMGIEWEVKRGSELDICSVGNWGLVMGMLGSELGRRSLEE